MTELVSTILSRLGKFDAYKYIYCLLSIVIVYCGHSCQQELSAINTDPFYIDLYHKFDLSGEFTFRGSLLVKPKAEFRPAQASFVQPQSELSDSEVKQLKESSQRGDTYFLKAALRNRKAKREDEPTKITQTLVRSCSLSSSNLSDNIVINVSPLNHFISLNHYTSDTDCSKEIPSELARKFNTTIQVDTGTLGPQPDTATYIRRIEEERKHKLKEGKEDNRSFFAKYWIYIVPAVVILMMMSGPEQGAR